MSMEPPQLCRDFSPYMWEIPEHIILDTRDRIIIGIHNNNIIELRRDENGFLYKVISTHEEKIKTLEKAYDYDIEKLKVIFKQQL